MNEKNWVRIGCLCLLVEKVVQHVVTAVLFVVYIDGIGTPDIGPWFEIDNSIMALQNGIVAILCFAAFFLLWNNQKSGVNLAIIIAVFDIVAEIVYHGIGFITVSFVVAIVLLILSLKYKRVEFTNSSVSNDEGEVPLS